MLGPLAILGTSYSLKHQVPLLSRKGWENQRCREEPERGWCSAEAVQLRGGDGGDSDGPRLNKAT